LGVKHLILALQFLTRVPLPSISAERSDFAAAMRWFPVAGIVVGGFVAMAVWGLCHIDPGWAHWAALRPGLG
jgi:adenosylcobinamide-GDP ribazoletransferase